MKKLPALIIILFTATMLHASYDEAVKLFQKKQYQASLKIVAEKLEVDKDMEPNSPNYKLRYLAAHIHWKLGNTKSVVAHFKRCMDIKKEAVNPYIDLAFYLVEQKRYGDAEIYLKKGLKIRNHAMLYYLLGRIALERGNLGRAKALFEKTNTIDPEIYVSYNDLGITLMKLKKYGEANTAFSVAIAIMPQSAELENNLGMSLEKMKKYTRAYEHYRKANAIDMENKDILANMVRMKKKIK